jgi:ABC-type dipeptide/oligopeptide/nickel transport system permease subunit
VTFGVNVLRSVPQIIGILAGDVVLTILIQREILAGGPLQLCAMAAVIAFFVFLEVTDLVRERIAYHESLDFVHAMLCCGISESRIVNKEILWKNSRVHLLHKAIALFGTAVFLQCSIDFIISVGLSTDVSSANFPVTLGSLLAKMDSKQDVLAIGTLFTDPLYIRELAVRHLQGLSVAFLIVFTLICVYKIANGTIRRFQL